MAAKWQCTCCPHHRESAVSNSHSYHTKHPSEQQLVNARTCCPRHHDPLLVMLERLVPHALQLRCGGGAHQGAGLVNPSCAAAGHAGARQLVGCSPPLQPCTALAAAPDPSTAAEAQQPHAPWSAPQGRRPPHGKCQLAPAGKEGMQPVAGDVRKRQHRRILGACAPADQAGATSPPWLRQPRS